MTAANSPTLVKDLQRQVKLLTDDLRTRSDDPADAWGQELNAEYRTATERGRTGLSWSEWRDGEVDLAAVAWVLATVFIRFCEDNDLIDGPWITGEGTRHGQAADNETAFYQAEPSRNARDWLRAGFTALASLPAGRSLLDQHNLIWRAPISADAAQQLLAFWRQQNADGTLALDFTDTELDTRFLGDLYQDLSGQAKKKYALLQTPVFVEEFILDRTLTPAITEFGLGGLKLIDPTCGSGHFLLGSFERLLAEWQRTAPAMDTRERVQKALDSVNGVDVNPFAVAIARFRLTVAALRASGITRLKDAPAYRINLATGDSLLYGHSGRQGDLLDLVDDEGAASFTYANEDVAEYPHILDRGTYQVVVGNPPYITVKDTALNEAYRAAFSTCKGKYHLSVPFMELFFELAAKGEGGHQAGFVGLISDNAFMNREFGSKLVEDLLSGVSLANPVDLLNVVDTSGAYIPGHGTPTVILVGRRRRPSADVVSAVLGVRGEPDTPTDPSQGRVWSEIRDHIGDHGFDGDYVSASAIKRSKLAHHPWSLNGGSAGALKEHVESVPLRLSDVADSVGIVAVIGEEEAFETPSWLQEPTVPFVIGEAVRDFRCTTSPRWWPYQSDLEVDETLADSHWMWPRRRSVRGYLMFGKTREQRGLKWFEYGMLALPKARVKLSAVLAEVATHNHVVLDRGGKVFNRSSPVIKLPSDAREGDYLDVLGVLNSSTACFWLRQVCGPKGGSGIGRGIQPEAWMERYNFNSSNWLALPLPSMTERTDAVVLDELGQRMASLAPAEVLKNSVDKQALLSAQSTSATLRRQMIFAQEELDWEVYRAFGIVDETCTYRGTSIDQLSLGQRSFEVSMARAMATGELETAWFVRHGSDPLTELPRSWPDDYAELVNRRIAMIASDPFVGLLERPEHKRRWVQSSWDSEQTEALRGFILGRLGDPGLWSDASGPAVLSVAQVADRVRMDADIWEAVRLIRGAMEVDLTAELGRLLDDDAVPYVASLRLSPSGLRKYSEWESVWEMQRREDAGETVQVAAPPKYVPSDFRRTAFWRARGKLDVPKEAFISYPGAGRAGDGSMVIGWAGWDHLQQARALARLIMDRATAEGWDGERLMPLIAGLVELEPWLHQWHDDPDPLFGGSPAVFMSTFIDDQLAALGKTRDDCKAWRP